MNLRHLEAFRAVMLSGSVTHAAQSLNLSQPAVSKMLAELEHQLGFQLFQRSRGSALTVTPEADAFYYEVERSFSGIAALKRVAEDIRNMATGTLRIAALPALAVSFLPRVIAGTVMVPVLTVVSNGVGMLGGMIISVTQLRVAASIYWSNVVDGLYMADIWMGLIKPVVLGFALVSIGCHVGLRTKGGTQGVGRATTNAVVTGSVAVLVLDFLITKLLISVLY